MCPAGFEDPANAVCSIEALRPNPLVLHGALVAGPKSPTDAGDPDRRPYFSVGWNDWRTDWIGNEPALEFNAGYSLALAVAISLPEAFWAAPTEGAIMEALLVVWLRMSRLLACQPCA